jgi:transcriptional regulator with XRE-family HTH domain
VLIGQILKAHRKKHQLTREAIANKLGMHKETLLRWENGERAPGIDLMVEHILPAYGCSVDEFFTELRSKRSPGSPVIVPNSKKSNFQGPGLEISYVNPELLGSHTTRIDQIVVHPGRKGQFISHPGFNYILVLRGKIRLHYASQTNGDHLDQHADLAKGDAIAFYTSTKHFVTAIGGEAAEDVVARPTWAVKTDQLWLNDSDNQTDI